MKIGLFVGRFQPFHRGHLAAVKQILKECDLVKIVLCSPKGRTYSARDPFTVYQRKRMIRLALKGAGITSYKVYHVRDVNHAKRWVLALKKTAGAFDYAYVSENKWSEKCFRLSKVPVRKTKFIDDYSSTKIREAIQRGKQWKHTVPPTVYSYITKSQLDTRVKKAPERHYVCKCQYPSEVL